MQREREWVGFCECCHAREDGPDERRWVERDSHAARARQVPHVSREPVRHVDRRACDVSRCEPCGDTRDGPPVRVQRRRRVCLVLARSTELPEGVEASPVSVEVTYPGRRQTRTVVQAAIGLATTDISTVERGGRPAVSLLVDGEVVRGEELFDTFRYRFDLPLPSAGSAPAPGEGAAGDRPPVIDRRLAEELDQYRGLWVAIENGHVVASGESLAAVHADAQAKGFPDPLFHRVPVHPERPIFLAASSNAMV